MTIRKSIRAAIGTAAAAALLASSGIAAAQSPASKLSLTNSQIGRAASPMKDSSSNFPFLIVFVVIAAGLGLYFAVDDSDDDVVSA